MTATLRPNAQLIAVAWLRSATTAGIPTGQIGTQLPRDSTVWADGGFVVVGPAVGGTPTLDTPVRRPVLQIDCYATNPNSGKPPWGKASAVAEAIVVETYNVGQVQRNLTLPTGYPAVRVIAAIARTEPQRRRSDPAHYARYGLDLQLDWTLR